MFNFINLIRNENLKIYKKTGTLVMIGILLASIIGIGFLQMYLISDNSSEDWRMDIAQQNASLEKNLSQEYLPKSAKENIKKEISVNNYRLENNIPPVSSKSLWGFMNSSQNLISLVTLFTIIVAAGSVAGEFSWGTIKLLLIRPVSRSKVLLSKYLASFIFAFALLVILFLFSFLIGAIFFGLEGVSQPYLAYVNGEVVEQSMSLHIISLYAYNTVNLLMMVTFAFMISTVFRSSSLAIGLAIFLMFTGQQFVSLFSQYSWVKYILFANTNLMQYIDGVPIVEGMTMQFSIIVLSIYFLTFNLLSWIIFNKRDVAA